jgi:hypothetical protein
MGQLVFQATAGGQVALVGPNPSASFSLNVPAVSGTLITSGDTGTVTNTILANSAIIFGSTSQALGSTVNALNGVSIGGTTASTGKFTSITNSGLTANQVVYAGTAGLESGSANMTFNGTALTLANNASIAGLMVGKGANSNAYSTALGISALNANTVDNNTGVGYNALVLNSTGNTNTGVGSFVLAANTTGSGNSAYGQGGMYNNTTGGSNTAIGGSALYSNTTASNNTAVGYQAGYGITTGASNTYIGYTATQSGATVTNEIVVGASLTGKGSNTAFIGGTSGAYNGANSTLWSITSDARIKKNVASLESGLDVISSLRPVEFDYIENDKHDIGFIAQEYQTVLPAQISEGEDGMLSLNQNLVPYLVKAIQELKAEVDSLKEQLGK